MAKRQSSGKRSTIDLRAIRLTVRFAFRFAKWAGQAPVPPIAPPNTVARSINEILIEISARNAKILACFYMQQALNALNDHIAQYGDTRSPATLQSLIKQRDALKKAMASYGCGSIL